MTDRLRKHEEPRTKRGRLLLVGTAIGVVLARLFDPVSGRRRRALVRDRGAAMFPRGGRKAKRLARYAASYARGNAKRAAHVREQPKDLDDATLADKVRTVIFRPADVPKGQINVNVQEGVVQLRGEVPRSEMIDDLEAQVRSIQGVREVENLLHLPA